VAEGRRERLGERLIPVLLGDALDSPGRETFATKVLAETILVRILALEPDSGWERDCLVHVKHHVDAVLRRQGDHPVNLVEICLVVLASDRLRPGPHDAEPQEIEAESLQLQSSKTVTKRHCIIALTALSLSQD
jgi:hypothetical protein